MDAFLSALGLITSPEALAAIVFGSIIGIVFGSIPGLTFTIALALMVPLTFTMDTAPAIGLLLGTFVGGMTGGSVSAILIGIPGTPSAAATVIDGYQMTRAGKASLALGTAVVVSAVGGLISLMIMMVSVDLVARVALQFGPAEIFALVLFGMSTICGLSGTSLVRGLIAGVIGLMLMTIGLDAIDGVQRMTFGTVALLQGVNLLVAMVALFAIPQVIQTLLDFKLKRQVKVRAQSVRAELPSIRQLWQNAGVMFRSAAIGTGIGAIPGTGGPIAAFIAYDSAKRFSKDKSRFGKGAVEGVVAPETANNAVTGGTMIPLLSLGIPGDPATAIILGALLIHGLVPGPLLFQTNPTEIYVIYLSITVAYLSVVAFQYFGIRFFVQILRVPPQILALAIMLMCVVGVFAIRSSFVDVAMMLCIGLIGYGLLRARIPITPIVLGLVLGPTLENQFRRAMILADAEGSYALFYASPAALFFFALTALVLGLQAYTTIKSKRAKSKEAAALDALQERENA